eukprot:TRINITY_DN7107_c0_g1_i1.p1 TRINITY_DN7107_c0_g1~~TRINITY_DN7107_c0_g1_i1.p1  ORF type:complete len:139 (-),score=15.07 TRINITY_DN7107_c0_g1_i1:80-496(-)
MLSRLLTRRVLYGSRKNRSTKLRNSLYYSFNKTTEQSSLWLFRSYATNTSKEERSSPASTPPLTSWKDLREIILNKQLEKLFRRPEVTDKYNIQIAKLSQEWESVGDFIMNREFGLITDLQENGKKKTILPDGVSSLK